jgi:hypothetical protein
MEELIYFSRILDKAVDEEKRLAGISEEEMMDHAAMSRLGMSTRLINDRFGLLAEIDGRKLECCKLLLLAYQSYEVFKKRSNEVYNDPSNELLHRTFTIFLVIGHLEDLLFFYKRIMEKEAIC